jgi:hypothetical protein
VQQTIICFLYILHNYTIKGMGMYVKQAYNVLIYIYLSSLIYHVAVNLLVDDIPYGASSCFLGFQCIVQHSILWGAQKGDPIPHYHFLLHAPKKIYDRPYVQLALLCNVSFVLYNLSCYF